MPDDDKTQQNALALNEGEAEIPDGQTGEPMEAPPLVIGAPFALSHDCALLTKEEGAPGCVAVVECDECQQKFKIDLLSEGVKHCPKCRTAFSHCLLVARTDDTEIIPAAMAVVLKANGYEAPAGMGDEDDEDDEDDEGEGDDE